MGLIERFVDEQEEELARVGEASKDCGLFRLGQFEGPDVGQFLTIEGMIAAVDEKLRNPLGFFGAESGLRSFRLNQNVLEFESVGTAGSASNTGRVTVHLSGRKRRAAIIVPHWNAPQDSYVAMAGALSWLGFSAFVLTLPHHHARSASPT